MSIFATTPQTDTTLLYVFLAISITITLSYLSFTVITNCCTRRPSPISSLPPRGGTCRHLKAAQLPSSSLGTLTANTTSNPDNLPLCKEEASETTQLLERPVKTSAKSVSSFCNNTPNNQLYSFAFTPKNILGMDSSCDDCRREEIQSGYGTTKPKKPSHTVVAMGMDVPRDAARAYSKREDLGGYDGSVNFGASVWSTTSSIGVNENRLYDHLLRCPEGCDSPKELKRKKDEWEGRERLLAQYAKQ